MSYEEKKKFIEQITVQVRGITKSKLQEEYEERKPGIEGIVDGYESLIQDLGGGFLEIAEAYNQCVEIAKKNELIGDTKLKARIKDFSSSKTNTDVKILDDIFGMELVTSTELEKEMLILFNHLAFKVDKDKKYNKTSGYVAYHCIGDFSPKEGDLKEEIKRIIEQAKTIEYKYSKSEPNYSNKKNMVYIFPRLQEYISNSANLNELSRVLKEMVDHMNSRLTQREYLPEIDFHFLTVEKEQEALRGKNANHANYKKVNRKLIENYFMEGRLIRGVNAPWKFVGGPNGLKLQDLYDTFLENWTFLKDEVVKKRISGAEVKDKQRANKIDVLTATQFPFLRKYLKGDYKYPEEGKQEIWEMLKELIIENKIDKSTKGNTQEENKGTDEQSLEK